MKPRSVRQASATLRLAQQRRRLLSCGFRGKALNLADVDEELAEALEYVEQQQTYLRAIQRTTGAKAA